MSRMLVSLLGVDERNFRSFIERLERVTLNPSIDIRLSAEIITKSRQKIKDLGLLAEDTKPEEVFFALLEKLKQADKKLVNELGIDAKSVDRSADIIAKKASKLSSREYTLGITPSGIKKILIAVPPRKTLRLLRLRSLESVIKREDPRIIYSLATLIEDKSWQSQVHAKMKRLPAKEIAWLKPQSVVLPQAWYEKIKSHIGHFSIKHTCPEAGTIVIFPALELNRPGMTTLALGVILQSLQILVINSLPYRGHGFLHRHEEVLLQIAHGKQPNLSKIHGLNPSWRAVYELISQGHIDDSVNDLDLVINELEWKNTEMKLASIVADFDFWVDSHYLAIETKGRPVSFHLLDLAQALVSKAEYQDHSTAHFEASLWNELQLRYLKQDALINSLTKQLRATD